MPLDKASVLLALHEIEAHPAVRDLQQPVFDAGAGAHVTFSLDLDFGARWAAEGASPTGVRPVEEVRLDFPGAFPSAALKPSLRADFDRNHPHIQPWLGPEDRVVPCVVDGPLNEFVAANGPYRLIDQIKKWLRSAAEGTLLDLTQGWEPMRRDGYESTLIADAGQLRGHVRPAAGLKFLRTGYFWNRPDPSAMGTYAGEAGEETTVRHVAALESSMNEAGRGVGSGLAMVIWAGRAAGGGPTICDRYVPDNVTSVGGLIARAKDLGMGEQLQSGLTLIRQSGKRAGTPQVIPVPVVMMVRRPAPVIGTDSDLELCAYLVPVEPSGKLDLDAPVRPLAHHDAISVSLLQRLSGDAAAEPWALLGCGSLGSKIALHRARAGASPSACADRAMLKPHNAARHGLYPRKSVMQLGWGGEKAEDLALAIEGLGQKTVAITGSHFDLAVALRKADGPNATWLVNTTASTVVREDLTRLPLPAPTRVAEGLLFGGGKLGVLSVEGAARNPNTAELYGELYEAGRTTPAIGAALFGGDGPGHIAVGQGCGSVTMVMSDAQISAIAAPISEALAGLSTDAEPGRVELFLRDGLSLIHTAAEVAAYRRVPLEGLDGWSVSVSDRAYQAIVAEAAAHPTTEAGGVLLGWVSMIARQIIVTSVMDAPPDSKWSAAEFELGTEGLRPALEAVWSETAGALVCVGTWHSHLGPATPSPKDRGSAALVGLHEPRPMAFLIYGVDGLRAISAAGVISVPVKKGK